MEAIEIAIEKGTFESTVLHVLSKIMPDSLEEVQLIIPAPLAEGLGTVVRYRMDREQSVYSDVLVPFRKNRPSLDRALRRG